MFFFRLFQALTPFLKLHSHCTFDESGVSDNRATKTNNRNKNTHMVVTFSMSGMLLKCTHYLFRYHCCRVEYELYGKTDNTHLFPYPINSTEPAPSFCCINCVMRKCHDSHLKTEK